MTWERQRGRDESKLEEFFGFSSFMIDTRMGASLARRIAQLEDHGRV